MALELRRWIARRYIIRTAGFAVCGERRDDMGSRAKRLDLLSKKSRVRAEDLERQLHNMLSHKKRDFDTPALCRRCHGSPHPASGTQETGLVWC